MFVYLYYRWLRLPKQFKTNNKLDPFADYCMDANLDSVKNKGDKIKERIRHLDAKKKSYIEKRERIKDEGVILATSDYHNIGSKVRRLMLLLILIFLAEAGLNYFTSLIAIPITDETKGLAFSLLRIAVAFVVTAIGIVCADLLFEEILPSKKYGQVEKQKKDYDYMRIFLWLFGLVVIEYMIYHFGLARVNDIEGGVVNSDTAKSLIILSMVVPVVAGGIGWEISNYKDAYRNRRLDDKCINLLNSINNERENLKEKENGYCQKKINNYWDTLNKLKIFKEYYNKKKGQETPELCEEQKFAKDFDRYYSELLRRYSMHKEQQDAVAKTKFSTKSILKPGEKIGQDHE